MAESIREIAARIMIDTNKRTITRTISADSLDELKERVIEEIEDIQEGLS